MVYGMDVDGSLIYITMYFLDESTDVIYDGNMIHGHPSHAMCIRAGIRAHRYVFAALHGFWGNHNGKSGTSRGAPVDEIAFTWCQ